MLDHLGQRVRDRVALFAPAEDALDSPSPTPTVRLAALFFASTESPYAPRADITNGAASSRKFSISLFMPVSSIPDPYNSNTGRMYR